MEPVGLTVGIVGLAGLFSVCLDVIDKVDSYKDFGVESRSIVAQFEADKYLFTKWAQDVGLDKEQLEGKFNNSLDNPKTCFIVHNILSSIQEIFSKTEGIVSNLQSVVEAGPKSFPDGIFVLNGRKTRQDREGAISKRGRIGWSFRNKAKFIFQVQQFEALVQRLNSLVPTNGLSWLGNVHQGTIVDGLSSRNGKLSSDLIIDFKSNQLCTQIRIPGFLIRNDCSWRWKSKSKVRLLILFQD